MTVSSEISDRTSLVVLLVDDNKDIRHLIAGMLRSQGVRTIAEAADGNDALRMLETTRGVDLVITNHMMSPVNGAELVSRMRKSKFPHVRDTPVIMLTARSDGDLVKAAAGLGVSAYIVKPVSPGLLWQRIDTVLGRKPVAGTVAMAAVPELQDLQARYPDILKATVSAMTAALAEIKASSGFQDESWTTIGRHAHDIKGQAAQFGLDLVAAIATCLDKLIRATRGQTDGLDARRTRIVAAVGLHLDALSVCLKHAVKGDGGEHGHRMLVRLEGAVSDALKPH